MFESETAYFLSIGQKLHCNDQSNLILQYFQLMFQVYCSYTALIVECTYKIYLEIDKINIQPIESPHDFQFHHPM